MSEWLVPEQLEVWISFVLFFFNAICGQSMVSTDSRSGTEHSGGHESAVALVWGPALQLLENSQSAQRTHCWANCPKTS